MSEAVLLMLSEAKAMSEIKPLSEAAVMSEAEPLSEAAVVSEAAPWSDGDELGQRQRRHERGCAVELGRRRR